MADYELLYWSVPFRGQFVRAVLAFAGKSWVEGGDGKISRLMQGAIGDMPVPFMGPPVLIELTTGFAIAEMPAIILYLGETLNLLPDTPQERAMTMKIVNDANDVIDEITLDGGKAMWTPERWEEFKPRLQQWMRIWEETGRRHGLQADSGFMLGGVAPAIADVITATLWTTMTDRFSAIRTLLEESAPMTAALCRRVSALPALSKLSGDARRQYGEAYAGGQIGQSMAEVLNR
ncbi:MAG TPA: glutathione S-transferase [Devosia sp.]|uniref:glutathione S-transferase n=1 Tax=Devosia sp. TaxID=1871048 RepID=UPI002F958AD5